MIIIAILIIYIWKNGLIIFIFDYSIRLSEGTYKIAQSALFRFVVYEELRNFWKIFLGWDHS